MNAKINLKKNSGFQWYYNKQIYVKGYAFDMEGSFYEKENLVSLFIKVNNINDLEIIVKNLNGSFAVIIKNGEEIYCAVDRLRSIPLFYSKTNELIITDTLELGKFTIKPETTEYHEFLLAGYTINDSTLLSEYKQIQASELIKFSRDKLQKKQYFKHIHKNFFNENYGHFYSDLNKITDNFIKRLINSTGNRTIIIPLSGGYDSRYILAGLRKLNFEKVICYTYGDKTSFEVSIASQVARTLGYKLYTVEYTEEKWRKLINNRDFINYINYSFNYTSLPHIQDFIALDELKSKNLLPDDSIIVPGFCGDLLGGSYIPIEIKENKIIDLLKKNIEDYIFKRHFSNIEYKISESIKKSIKEKINNNLLQNQITNTNSFVSQNESFFTEHKVSKFVINALRPYEFFGYEWRIPLWDNELMEYWYKIPYNMRIDNTLYNNFLFNELFEKQNIAFYKKKSVSENKLIMVIRKSLPLTLTVILKNSYTKLLSKIVKKDINNFFIFGETLKEDINKKNNMIYKNINGVLSHWILIKNTSQKP